MGTERSPRRARLRSVRGRTAVTGFAAVAIVAGMFAAVGSGLAVAAVQDQSGAVQVCYHVDGKGQLDGDGKLRLIDPASTKHDQASCKKDERLLVLSGPELPHNCTNGQIASWSAVAQKWICGADQTTTYSAGTGLSLQGTTFSVDPTAVQSRLKQGCSSSQAMQSVAQDGTVSCVGLTPPNLFTPPSTILDGTIQGQTTVLASNGSIQVVGICSYFAGSVEVHGTTGAGATVSADTDAGHVTGTPTSGGGNVQIAALDPGHTLLRGDFDIVDNGSTATLDGSFLARWFGPSAQHPGGQCQFQLGAVGATP